MWNLIRKTIAFAAVTLAVFATKVSPNPLRIAIKDVIHEQNTSCNSEPEIHELKNQYDTYRQSLQLPQSLYNTPFVAASIATELQKSENDHIVRPNVIYGKKECPSLQEAESACPSFYVENRDTTRYPQVLYESKCSECTHCLGVQESTDSTKTCQGVYYNIPVLRKTDRCTDGGVFIYENSWHKLGVGCACKIRQPGATAT